MIEMEFLKNLLTDAELEMEYMRMYDEETEKAKKDNSLYAKIWRMRNPSRQRIKDDLKMIRRITLSIERGLNG